MFRSFARCAAVALTFTMLTSVGAAAEDVKAGEPVAPSAAVAKAWAKEAGGSSTAVRSLLAAYAVTQGLDMTSTIMARRHGAVEANPSMRGSYAQGMLTKAALGSVTMLAVRSLNKRHKKAAVVTMIALNAATAAAVANNMRNASRLK